MLVLSFLQCKIYLSKYNDGPLALQYTIPSTCYLRDIFVAILEGKI